VPCRVVGQGASDRHLSQHCRGRGRDDKLHLRWAGHGQVVWRGAALEETAPPGPRKVRLAAVNHRPRGNKSSRENLDQFATLIAEAGRQKADIVCLPEGITVAGTGKTYAEVAEPVPGPSTEFLGRCAREHRIYVVAGLYERDSRAIYNTAVLLGRDGRLVGKYRKVCLPREEIDGGLTPAKDYPVFDTDFGRVGLMICWDVHFPEVARELAAGGAEVILLPIWGGNETLAKARAIENQVYLVAAGYEFPTVLYDRAGKALAAATKDPEVIVIEVDLNERTLWPWLGD
jgi:predicted amidohydrolase